MLKRLLKPVLGPCWRVMNPTLRATGLTAFRHFVDIARAARLLPRISRNAESDPECISTVLIVHLTPHLGDTILQLPLIEALRETYPKAEISCAIQANVAPLLRALPSIDHVYAFTLSNAPPTTIRKTAWRILGVVVGYWRMMRTYRADVCVIPRWGDDQYRSLCLAYLVGTSRRIGFASDVNIAATRAAPYRDALLTEIVRGGNGMHEAERSLFLLKASRLIPDDLQVSANRLGLRAINQIAEGTDWPSLAERIGLNCQERFAVIAPGASQARRVWPVEMWAEVMAELRQEGWQVVLVSGSQDAPFALELYSLTGKWAKLAAGTTSLIESVALISKAGLFLGNDSGPGHVAGAAGVPSVILFVVAENVSADHHATPVRIAPLGELVRRCLPSKMLPPCELSCEAAEAHCIRTISPRMILDAAEEIVDLSNNPALGYTDATR